jgi:hypothetical protein
MSNRYSKVKDEYVIRGEADRPEYYHIVPIKDRRIQDTALCGKNINWAKPVHMMIAAVSCEDCKKEAEKLGLIPLT